MTVFEADGEVVVVDAGLAFPRDEHLGVDLILPDFSYLTDLERPVRAILLTHGHEDHVGRLAELGTRGVDLLLGDSINAERPGVTGSDRLVGEGLHQIIPTLTGRVLVASFASNIHRMQHASAVAVDAGSKLAVVGGSRRK